MHGGEGADPILLLGTPTCSNYINPVLYSLLKDPTSQHCYLWIMFPTHELWKTHSSHSKEEDHREKCHFHHIILRCMLSTWLTTVDIDLGHLTRKVLVRFHHCNHFSPPFDTALLDEITMRSLYLGLQKLKLHSISMQRANLHSLIVI